MGVYERIEKLCKEKGIAITALERELDFSRGSIGKMRTAKRPNAERLQKIAEYFDVPVSQLMENQAPPKKNNIIRVYTAHSTPQTDAATGNMEVFTGKGRLYYLDDEAAELAQKYFDHPEYRVLFDALEGSSPDNIEFAADILNRMKKTNPDG